MHHFYHKNPERFILLTIKGSTITTLICLYVVTAICLYHYNFPYDIKLNAFPWFCCFLCIFRELGQREVYSQ